jgi:hypothetical protein
MRRFWGYLLVFLGVFLVVFAAVVKFAVAGPAVKAPLSIPEKYIKIIAAGTDFNYFDGNSKVAVYDESLCLTRDTDGSHPGCVDKADPQKRLITNSTDRVAFDRKSAMAVNDKKYGANVDGNSAIKHDGLSYKFPIDTKKQTYPFFDTVVGKAFPMRYAAKEKLAGLTVYKFVQTIVDQPVYTNHTFPSTYTNTRTVWVEPTTGVIVKGQEELKQVLTGREGLNPNSPVTEPGLAGIVALQGTLAFTPATVRLQAQLAKDNLPKIHLVRLWLPLSSLIVGVVALAAAVWVFRSPPSRPGRRRRRHASDTPPQPDAPRTHPEESAVGPGQLFEGSGSGSSPSA